MAAVHLNSAAMITMRAVTIIRSHCACKVVFCQFVIKQTLLLLQHPQVMSWEPVYSQVLKETKIKRQRVKIQN